MKTKFIPVLFFGFFAAISQAKNSSQMFAQCESDAYGALGIQTNRSANSTYLEKKYELVRVCMLRQGAEYNSKGTVFLTGVEWASKAAEAYRQRGLASTPSNQIPQDVHEEIREQLLKERAIRELSRDNWK